jgi:clan AA aspartic protease (TIGR02281 family)
MKSTRILLAIVLTLCSTSAMMANEEDLKSGISAYNENDYNTAKTYFDKCITDNEKDVTAYYYRGETNEKITEFNDALSDFNNAIKYNKDKKQFNALYYERAYVYYMIDEYGKAIDDYTTALKYKKDDGMSLTGRSIMYRMTGNYDASDADCKAALQIDDSNIKARIGLGKNEIARKNYQNAIDLLGQAERYSPSNHEVQAALAMAWMGKGDYRQAADYELANIENGGTKQDTVEDNCIKHIYNYWITQLNGKVNNNPNDKTWLSMRAKAYYTHCDYKKAVEDYTKLTESSEDATDASGLSDLALKANAQMRVGDLLGAIETYSKAIEKPTGGILRLLRGKAYEDNGDYEMAIKDFTQEIGTSYNAASSYAERGKTHFIMGKTKEAIADEKMAIDIENDNYKAMWYLALMYHALGDTANTRLYANMILGDKSLKSLDVADDMSLQKSIMANLLLGTYSKAKSYIDKAYGNSNDDSRYELLSLSASIHGDQKEALEDLKQSLAISPQSPVKLNKQLGLEALVVTPEYKTFMKGYTAHWDSLQAGFAKARLKINDETEEIKSTVDIKKTSGNLYEVPCRVNDLPLKFLLDTGASTVTISSVEAGFMYKNGYLTDNNIMGSVNFVTANGEIAQGTMIKLRKVTIGDVELKDIEASVVRSQTASILLGQSVLNKFGRVEIDYNNLKLTMTQQVAKAKGK